MDFWSRIVRGSTLQKKKTSSSNSSSPQLRQAHFKRAYNNLLQIWRNGDVISTDVFAAENVRLCIRRMTELLSSDQRGPTPHLCVSFAATSRVLVTVARVSAAFKSDVISYEALGFCSILIESEEEAFLEDRAFADTLPDFIESVQQTIRHTNDRDIESAMVEMLFGIAAKLRIEPHVLRVWFRPEKPDDDDEELSDSEKRTRFEEFPLFYLLLHYIPVEGRAGEFARMGLLYIIETTSHSEDLEHWMVEGDMSALMASSLGALYSQLGRKLATSYRKDEVPSILTFSTQIKGEPAEDVELTTSKEYHAHLSTFLASLIFWQDILEHCSSTDVKQTLLDHFQYLFLQQLLYPSLLESSDVDGGSAVAVLTYLRHILESIDHHELVRLTIRYLFGKESKPAEAPGPNRPISQIRRRKSAHLMARVAEEEHFSPNLFNLTDLICSSLRSRSQQTVAATLHLLSTMLKRPQHQSLPGLLRTRPLRLEAERRTFGGQLKEIDNLLTLAGNLTSLDDLEVSYDKHLHDNRNVIESHPCSMELLQLASSEDKPTAAKSAFANLEHRILSVEDPILKGLLVLLKGFFRNDIETNLGLTQVIIDFASCGYLSLEGWLLTHPSKYRYADGDSEGRATPERPSLPSDEEAEIHRINLSKREPTWDTEDTSQVSKVLHSLMHEVKSYHQDIPDFDTLLVECKTVVQGLDADIASSIANTPIRHTLESGRSSPSNQRSGLGRLNVDHVNGGDTAAESPRGRLVDSMALLNITSRFNHLQSSTSRSPSERVRRNYSLSPLRHSDTAHFPRKTYSTLQQLIKLPAEESTAQHNIHARTDSDNSSLFGEIEPTVKTTGSDEIPLGQLMTNIIILQEFVLELAALIQIRASLFGEVKYL